MSDVSNTDSLVDLLSFGFTLNESVEIHKLHLNPCTTGHLI